MQWAKRLDHSVQKINAALMVLACIFLGILVVTCIMMVLTRFIPNFTLVWRKLLDMLLFSLPSLQRVPELEVTHTQV